MRLRSKRGPIPLPDAEVVARCTIVRALFAVDQIADCTDYFRSRVLRWAGEADASGLDLLALGWPDKKHCFALAPRTESGSPVLLEAAAILAAYRHALNDPRTQRLFNVPRCDSIGGGL